MAAVLLLGCVALASWRAAAPLRETPRIELQPALPPSPAAPDRAEEARRLLAGAAPSFVVELDRVGKHAYRTALRVRSAPQVRQAVEQELAACGVSGVIERARRDAPKIMAEQWPSRLDRVTATSGLLALALLDRLFAVLGIGTSTGARELLAAGDFVIQTRPALEGSVSATAFPLPEPITLDASFESLGRDFGIINAKTAESRVEATLTLPDLAPFSRAELALRVSGLERESYVAMELAWGRHELSVPFFSDSASKGPPVWLTQQLDARLLGAGPVRARLRYGLLPGSLHLAPVRVLGALVRFR